MNNLVRSHRTFGKLIGRTVAETGEEFAILQTTPHGHAFTATPAHLLFPVEEKELHFEARMALHAAIERCAFLGVDLDTLPDLLRQEIALYKDEQL